MTTDLYEIFAQMTYQTMVLTDVISPIEVEDVRSPIITEEDVEDSCIGGLSFKMYSELSELYCFEFKFYDTSKVHTLVVNLESLELIKFNCNTDDFQSFVHDLFDSLRIQGFQKSLDQIAVHLEIREMTGE